MDSLITMSIVPFMAMIVVYFFLALADDLNPNKKRDRTDTKSETSGEKLPSVPEMQGATSSHEKRNVSTHLVNSPDLSESIIRTLDRTIEQLLKGDTDDVSRERLIKDIVRCRNILSGAIIMKK
ncbi:hypothetical protein [Erwinia sp. S38]|uniref:hypothetical protein n=1 Tax=Erwinia sp. S38 TaxID=2769338 RepID=UPI00190DD807|nr:hypothetical protein [Erwinia sp. S38]MBK0004240.1 hypothetical protein [Erwinia sp. S38]